MACRPTLLTCMMGVLFLNPLLGTEPPEATKRPNILYIMADDHTSQAWGCYGGHLAEFCPTQNIDRLAAEGARLTNSFCTNSICVPSRGAILTGQYSHVNGIKTLSDTLDPQTDNVAKHLQQDPHETCNIYDGLADTELIATLQLQLKQLQLELGDMP